MEEKSDDTAPRKRSKVSRACDACRRKKVRCDGEFSNDTVTKKCTNCHKNNDTCTFSRIPLKRGPSKGYIRDLEEKLELARPRKQSIGAGSSTHEAVHLLPFPMATAVAHSSSSSTITINSQPIPPLIISGSGSMSGPLGGQPHTPQPQPPTLSILGTTSLSSKQNSSPIILPPLVSNFSLVLPHGLQNIRHKENTSSSTPSSPRNGILNPANQLNNGNNTSNNGNPTGNNVNGSNANNGTPNTGSAQNGTTNGTNSNQQNRSPPIQGPFWKVPYEMPSGTLDNRRSSIESISSTTSSASGVTRSRLPSLKPSISASDTAISDSEDEFYSVKSYSRSRSSQSSSPRNSISSLSSLNGRMNKVNIEQLQPPPQSQPQQQPQQLQPQQQPQQPQHQHQLSFGGGIPQQTLSASHTNPGYFGTPSVFAPGYTLVPVSGNPAFTFPSQGPPPPHPYGAHAQGQQAAIQLQQQHHHHQQQQQQQQQQHQRVLLQNHANNISSIPLNNLEQNLKMYYQRFHKNFPILPFNESLIKSNLDSMILDDQAKFILDLFNHALNNLNNYNLISLKDNVQLFNHILSIYPFATFNINLNNHTLVFFFSSLVLINYSILLNGDVYSIGLSIARGIFNDFKVLEKFKEITENFKKSSNSSISQNKEEEYDSIQYYLPKLYLCTTILDYIYSIGFGVQLNFSSTNKLNKNLFENLFLLVPPNCKLYNGISNFKIGDFLIELISARDEKVFNTIEWRKFNLSNEPAPVKLFSSYFIDLVKDKFEVLNYLREISCDFHQLDGETLHDHQLKLCRIVKKLSSSIVNLANYIPTNSASNALMNLNSNGMDSSNGLTSTNSSFNNGLLITPLLNLSFGQSYKLIKLVKIIIDSIIRTTNDGELFNRCLKISNDLSIAYNLLNSNLNNLNSPILGSTALVSIKNKLEVYDLHLTSPIANQMESKGAEYWKIEYQQIINFTNSEFIYGWN